MNNVEVIKVFNNPSRLIRVAGYARVSTADEHQDSSYTLQSEELENEIKSNPRYEFIGIFKDKKSGRYTKHRTEFNAMIELALLGEIDIIITKSITRFARNILDTISIVRNLKNHNVEVIFQKENISSLDPSIEFVLSILAMQAEEEIKNMSDNTKWSIKRRVREKGNLTTNLYGYKIKGEEWTIVESEAKIVRMIFKMYLDKTPYRIMVEKLAKMGVKTSTGKDKWHIGTLEQMLQNEKYAGHMAYGKSYIFNGTTLRSNKITKKENMIFNHHVPIINQDMYDKAQTLRESKSRNNLDCYVPLSERQTPYHNFVFSVENNRYLRYVMERPKGKYEIPTLYCYNNDFKNRVMLRVDNLFIILNDALTKLSQSSADISVIFTKVINDSLMLYSNASEDTSHNKRTLLSNKVSLLNSKKILPNYVKRIKNFKSNHSIDEFRNIIDKVKIIDASTFEIKLSLVNLESINYFVTHSIISIKIGNLMKEIKYYIVL